MAYMVKALDILGNMPELDSCVCCGGPLAQAGNLFSVEEGGMMCAKCGSGLSKDGSRPLIYEPKFAIVDVLKYFQKHPLSAFRKLALDDQTLKMLQPIMQQYLTYHLDIRELKSEGFFKDGL
jgi:DNA repair protein RecO (recombination protein O)